MTLKILAFFSPEIMGSPNILLGIPLIKKKKTGETTIFERNIEGSGICAFDERVWNPVICVKNVGAGTGNEHMDI